MYSFLLSIFCLYCFSTTGVVDIEQHLEEISNSQDGDHRYIRGKFHSQAENKLIYVMYSHYSSLKELQEINRVIF